MSAVSGDGGDRGPDVAAETPLGRVRGLGPAHSGAHHWGLERATALATLLLFVWFLVSLWRLPDLDQATIAEWLRAPIAAAPMLLLVLATFWHLKLGLVVVVEDYVHDEGGRLFWTMLIGFASLLAGAIAAVAVLKIALSGGAG